MKKGTFFGSVAVVAAVAASGYFLLRPTATPQEVKNPVDEQYEQLSIQLNDLEAKVKQAGANVDSLTDVLETIKWSAVKEGGEYEMQKRNLYLDAKRNVAMTFYTIIQEQGLDVSSPLFDDIEAISE